MGGGGRQRGRPQEIGAHGSGARESGTRGSGAPGSRARGNGRGIGWRLLAAFAAAVVVGAGLPAATATASPRECAPDDQSCLVDRYLQQARTDPQQLEDFIAALPKGGDLHHHLTGAASTESLIRYAAEDGRCLDTRTLTASPGPCRAGQRPARDAEHDPQFREQVLRAWSMHHFDPNGPESGHDHFFATFGKFGAATDGRYGDMLAQSAQEAQRQNESYVEPLFGVRTSEVGQLGQQKGFDPGNEQQFAQLRQRLLPGLRPILRAGQQDTSGYVARARQLLRCGTPTEDPACNVRMAFDYQVLREQPPRVVFASLLAGFEMARRDRRFVGINMVQPEDGHISLRDYALHMRMVGYLHRLYPQVHVTLHAGELVPGLAKPEDLRFHIDQAVRVAGAERVGHAVDLEHERAWPALLARMRENGVLVESPLTSNCQILRACGPADHPLPRYLASGVPVALATDDPGVSRSDINADYRRAVEQFGLHYQQLKASARNSLEHAFLHGASLWEDVDEQLPVAECAGDEPGKSNPSEGCADFLKANPKAAAQWDLEHRLREFEDDYAARGSA